MSMQRWGQCLEFLCHCRDIKLENTLLDGSKRLVKITDFGYAKSNIDSMPISNVGTPNYAGKTLYIAHETVHAESES